MRASLCFAILSLFGAAHAAPGEMMCIAKTYLETGLEVKEEAQASSKTLMVIGAGRPVLDMGRAGEYVFVGVHRAGGIAGYVPANALSRQDLDGMRCGS